VVPVPPERALLKQTRVAYGSFRYGGDSDLCMAVFCHRRGWTALAQEFLRRKLTDYRQDVREEFAYTAWAYWESVLIEPRSDRKIAAKYLC
jgi:hypothetical protein